MSSASDILSLKQPQLNSPGHLLNSLYPSKFTVSTEGVENTAMWQNVISLPSASFNSATSVQLPIDQMISHVILHVRLENLSSNVSLPRGWIYAAINNCAFTLGSSSSVATNIPGFAILQTVLAQCHDAERRDEILRLGGEEQFGPALAPVGQTVPHLDAYAIIPTPFSTACNAFPIDSTLLSQPIKIDIAFNAASAFMGGSGTKPTAFSVAEISLHQLKLSNQAASLRQNMRQDPSLTISYPWIMSFPFTSPQFAGHRDGDPGTQCLVQLNGFPDGDLLGIVMWIIRDSDVAPSANSTPNPFNCDEISDLVIDFNGSQIYRQNGKQYKLAGLLQQQSGAAYFDHSIVAPGATAPFSSSPKRCYPIFVDFTRMRACPEAGREMANTWRLTNQTLTCRFNTQYATTYRMYCTYMVNSVALLADGVSNIQL